MADSSWTRVLAENIKSVAQAQGALGAVNSPQSNSPYASQLGIARSSAHMTRRRSSTLGSTACCTSGANFELLSGTMTPRMTQGGVQDVMTTSASLDVGRLGVEPVVVPSILPESLLEEARKAGVSLEVDLDTDVAFPDGEKPLGRGVSGTVFKATYKGHPCAVKMLPPEMLFGPGTAELQTFVQEMVVLASVCHPNIVTFLGGSLQPPSVFCIEELCEMSLDAWLHKGVCSRPMNSWQVLKVALDVATGLQYLHEHQPAIVHRDLKPANILLDEDWNAKISDFGLARVKTHAVINTKAPEVGSIGYMAPECFTSEDGALTDKCDTWSLGVVLWEMVTRKRPWPGLTMPQYYREVVVRKSRLEVPMDDNVCPMALRRLISSCWADDPEERPSCAHIVGELSRLLKYCPRD
ncbi:hypothetical protein GPECTOR_1g639 [Gonium pectorale]|uniref:non-specific serine/threonine protein kinase n=1 Tax=Gonium pectorale TaxID=33097 RepID=A0A150H3H6_GONPE|nr:hypothetical protein GPECTOR_1g639 [Gonium pectorale]|eukprot:KXZ56709.1 hypothetical protein GPECTOR_1g639 [Gonium pectorale]